MDNSRLRAESGVLLTPQLVVSAIISARYSLNEVYTMSVTEHWRSRENYVSHLLNGPCEFPIFNLRIEPMRLR
jgi:hypothetical protein